MDEQWQDQQELEAEQNNDDFMWWMQVGQYEQNERNLNKEQQNGNQESRAQESKT